LDVALYRNVAHIAGIALLLTIGSIAAACFLWGSDMLRDTRELMSHGVIADGIITARTHASTGPSGQGMPYLLSYQFTLPDGHTITLTESVPPSVYNAFPPGAAVTIRYAADGDDARLALAEAEDSRLITAPLALAFGAGLLLWAAYLGILKTTAVWKDARLTLYGKVLTGRVLTCQRTIPPQARSLLDYTPVFARYDIDLRYRFISPSGHVIQHAARQNRPDLAHTPLPRFGAGVAVLYLNDHVFRVL
jgi:hypothetical protein